MYISKLKIKNFKCFDEVEINFDPNFNLIIGENNSGKSTIFEALRLWQLAIQQFYTARTYKKKEGNIGFYRKFVLEPLLLNDISFLRIEDLNEVLHKRINSSIVAKHFDIDEENRTFIIELTFSNGKSFASIPIQFKPNSRNTLNCKIHVNDDLELKSISNKLSEVMEIAHNDTFRNRIRLGYIPPKFNLPNKEILLSERNNYITEKLIMGESQKIIRNILHSWAEYDYQKITKKKLANTLKNSKNLLKDTNIDLNQFQIDFNDKIKPYIENVLGFSLVMKKSIKSNYLKHVEEGLREILNQNFNFKSFNNPLHNYTLQIRNVIDNSEISQLGSGSINVLNILCVMKYNEQTIDKSSTKCNLLLLDEPDSHLHSNLQYKLFEYLYSQSKDTLKQFFIISHNSGLISQFNNVIYIQKNKRYISPITIDHYLENHLKDIDENHYRVIKELNEVKNKIINIENRIEDDDKIYFLFEGPTDREIFKIAFEKLYDVKFPFEIIDTVSSAASITTSLNSNTKKLGYLIGIYDNDHTGRTQFNNLNNSFKVIELDYIKQKSNNIAFLLPIPEYRKIPFFKRNLTIEYLFNDDDLNKMLGDELFIKEDGENYKKIKPEENKDAYVISSLAKDNVCKKCKELPKVSFSSFQIIFDRIKKITNYS